MGRPVDPVEVARWEAEKRESQGVIIYRMVTSSYGQPEDPAVTAQWEAEKRADRSTSSD